MNPGARRAGAGQGVAAARLLVTLSLLRGVVEAQVSRRWREAGRPEGGGRPDASRKRGAATLGWRRGKRKKVRARRRRFPEDLWSRREGGRENGPAVGRERAQERGGLGLEADPRPGEPGAGADATSLPELSDRRVPGVPARDRCLARRAAPGGVLVQPRAGRKPGQTRVLSRWQSRGWRPGLRPGEARSLRLPVGFGPAAARGCWAHLPRSGRAAPRIRVPRAAGAGGGMIGAVNAPC